MGCWLDLKVSCWDVAARERTGPGSRVLADAMAQPAAAAASEVHGRWCWSAPCLALFSHGCTARPSMCMDGKCLIVDSVTRADTGGVCRTTTIYLEWRKKFLQGRGISSDTPEDHQSASHGCTSRADSAVLGSAAHATSTPTARSVGETNGEKISHAGASQQ